MMKFVSVPDHTALGAVPLDFEGLYADERWRVLGDMIPDGLVLVDPSGVIRYMNSAAESVTEVSRAMIVGRSLADFVQQSRIDCSVLGDAFTHASRINKIVRDAE